MWGKKKKRDGENEGLRRKSRKKENNRRIEQPLTYDHTQSFKHRDRAVNLGGKLREKL